MNYWLLIGCFFMECVFCHAQGKAQFGICSATITYTHSGSGYGSSTLYFDDFGYKKANQTVVRADSQNGKIIGRYDEVFIDNEPIPNNYPVTKTKSSPTRAPLSNSMTTTVFTNEMLNNLGFFESGECMVVGKTCVKYIRSSDTICLWNGIVLKASMHLSVVSINIEAVDIDLKAPPDSVFRFKTENNNF